MKYRIATISDCEALTELRMRMRKEFTTKYPNGRTARLMNMYVEPFYRHRGIAKELLNYAMIYAKEHQIGKVMLNPSPMGKSLYENYGFQLLSDEYVFYLH